MKTETPNSTEFESAIYKGIIRHRRYIPSAHTFEYPIFMMLLKVDEISGVMQKFWQLGTNPLRWARYRRGDYVGGNNQDLSMVVKGKIAEMLGKQLWEIQGDVYLLGQLRYFGFYFSPLNLYYLKQDGQFRYVLAEVSNTPWNKKHYYLVDSQTNQRQSKEFHVSPFNPMEQDYQWRVVPPSTNHDHCLVHIDIFSKGGEQEKILDATLNLKRLTLNQKHLVRVLLTTPVQTFSIVVGIYWQALKLLVKRTPFYQHPRKSNTRTKEGML